MECINSRFIIILFLAGIVTTTYAFGSREQEKQTPLQPAELSQPEITGTYRVVALDDIRVNEAVGLLKKSLPEKINIVEVQKAWIQTVAGYKIRLEISYIETDEKGTLKAEIYLPPTQSKPGEGQILSLEY